VRREVGVLHNTAGGNLYKTEKMKEMSENDVRFLGFIRLYYRRENHRRSCFI
jgi:hypothetical protein